MRLALLALIAMSAAAADAPTAAADGRFGAGLACAGAAALVVPHDERLESERLTVECWLRLDAQQLADPAIHWVLAKNGDASGRGHYGLCVSGDKVGALIGLGGPGTAMAFSTTRRMVADRWHHLAFTFDGSELKVFLDGEPAAAAVCRPRPHGDGAFAIGGLADGGGGIRGTVDEVVAWSRPLPRAELQAHARGERAAAADPGIIRRWTFDDDGR